MKVHGTRLASDRANPQTERFEEETNSMIVFPEGGVIRMTTPVSVGQMLVLTNLKSRQDAICRVAKVRKGYVEIEFTRPQPQYWGVYFTARNQRPAAANLPKTPATPPAISTVVPEAPVAPSLPSPPQESAAPESVRDTPNFHETNPIALVVPPAPPVKPPAPVKPLAPVVARPAQKVQPYARPTARLGVPDELILIADSTEPPAYSSDLPSFTQPELHIAGSPAPAPKPPELDAIHDASTATASAEVEAEQALPSPAEKTQPAPVLGASLRSTTSRSAGSLALIFDTENDQPQPVTRAPERNWFLIGAGVALLLATIAGGAWYFQAKVGSNTPVAPANKNISAQPAQPTQQPTATQPQSPAVPQAAAPEVQVASIPAEEPVRATPKEESSASSPLAPKPNKAANASKPSTETSSRSASAEPPAIESKPASKLGAAHLITPAMKAHPLSAQRSIDLPSQAPALDTSAGAAQDSANLLGLGSSNTALPPPPPGAAPHAPVRVGDTVKEPQLISRVMPEYPFAAKEANVQGDVVIDTLISTNGSVARMKVISGPAMLREAALNALRRWRYQPSELDGKPVAVQMLVTIRFRL